MTELRKGQRVRVTYEAVVLDPDPDEDGEVYVRADPAHGQYVNVGWLEPIEPIDNPAADPVGTVRRKGTQGVFVKLPRSLSEWSDLHWESVTGGGANSDATMRGSEIIGVVPGSPADVS